MIEPIFVDLNGNTARIDPQRSPAVRYAKLRAALAAVPHVKWSASRSNFTIPETDDRAGTTVLIGGLDKSASRPYARYIADANPETIRALLADFDEASARALHSDAVAQAAMEDNQRLREIVEMMAAGNTEYDVLQAMARAALAQQPRHGESHIAQQPSAQDREDAERYRWLRDQPKNETLRGLLDVVKWESDWDGDSLRGLDLDAAIDAARATKEE